MTVSIPPGFAECIIPITSSASSHVATITFGLDMGSSAGSPESCDLILTAFAESIGLDMDSNTLAGPTTLLVGQDGGPPVTVVGTITDPGDVTRASLPANCAALYKKSSATGGRRGRGRFFVPWVVGTAETDEGGIISSGVLPGLNTHAAAFLAALVTESGMSMVVLHSPGISTAGPPSAVTSLTVDRLIATQRRRLGR